MKLNRLIAATWRRQWPWLLLGITLMLASSAAALVLLGLSGWLITASAMAGLGMIAAVDIFTPGGGIRLAAITRTVARYGERMATHQATLGLLASLRVSLLERLLKLDELQLRRLRRGETLDRFTRDVEALDHLYSGVVGPIVTAALTTLGVAATLLLLVSPMAALVIAGVGLTGAIITLSAGRIGRAPGRARALSEPALRRRCTDSLEGLKSLVAERRVPDHRRALERLSTRQIDHQLTLDRIDAAGRGLVDLAGFLGVWGVLLISLTGFSGEQFSGPVAVMAVIVTLGLIEVWQALPSAWRQMTRTRLAAERVAELAERKPLLAHSGNALPPADGGELSVEALHFAWPDSPQPLIEHLNLELGRGERLLVTGVSGSGKTTLALLLMRQIDPDSGVIRLDGLDLRDIDADALRRRIGYLPQQPTLFGDTLAANLRVAAPDADEAAMAKALDDAGLGQWLASLEKGLETWLDEGGASLSGGELRRIGLARLMLVDPPVVILDEPTTGLDRTTAGSLASGLERWIESRTVVMISHEPELLPRYDRVLRL
ncbi:MULTISPECIES: thiol reductant ABC exporter subunit CydC [unclassified Wenzhouxiangella]|uniref:thiol reductant ABC exporter subunit CydC n=1 Tax=unclassified Wenzhouxiangella TaxID=2613841 RepID=UPI000E32A092|nr:MULTISPECIES: thiol reductant ABC exporter subunit CydC [unclassified Wenzhouxiangella]RFF27763.1 thiol reductant ABC exporter subunit CydC [Wenzhouxiangella sp. 15181]RFP68392.1 thiol reductant ABC exporter subunit CydC [Wenzhouxiangella sp. 15190]